MWKSSKIIWTANIGGCWPDDVPYYCDTLLRVQPTVAGKLAISLHPQFVVHVLTAMAASSTVRVACGLLPIPKRPGWGGTVLASVFGRRRHFAVGALVWQEHDSRVMVSEMVQADEAR